MVVALDVAGNGVLSTVIELEQHRSEAGVLGAGMVPRGMKGAGEGRHQRVEGQIRVDRHHTRAVTTASGWFWYFPLRRE
jgi:hypothetical protein